MQIIKIGLKIKQKKNCENKNNRCENKTIQESPPAWTQEAYRQRRIKYSICYPVRGGYPPFGVPPWPVLTGGYPRWGTPCRGTPGKVQLGGYLRWGTPGVPPSQVWEGGHPRWDTPCQSIPLARSNGVGGTPAKSDRVGVPEVGYPPAEVPPSRVPPAWTWLGYPPTWTWPGYSPGWTWLGYPPNLNLAGVPPLGVDRQTDGWMDEWMDRHVSKHYLPVVLRTRSVKTSDSLNLLDPLACRLLWFPGFPRPFTFWMPGPFRPLSSFACWKIIDCSPSNHI